MYTALLCVSCQAPFWKLISAQISKQPDFTDIQQPRRIDNIMSSTDKSFQDTLTLCTCFLGIHAPTSSGNHAEDGQRQGAKCDPYIVESDKPLLKTAHGTQPFLLRFMVSSVLCQATATSTIVERKYKAELLVSPQCRCAPRVELSEARAPQRSFHRSIKRFESPTTTVLQIDLVLYKLLGRMQELAFRRIRQQVIPSELWLKLQRCPSWTPQLTIAEVKQQISDLETHQRVSRIRHWENRLRGPQREVFAWLK